MYGLETNLLRFWGCGWSNAFPGRCVHALAKRQAILNPITNPPEEQKNKISFGGIPNSRNVLSLQDVRNRAAKPSAGNTSAMVS